MSITLEQVHEDIMSLKKEIERIRTIVEEHYELADDVLDEIKESTARNSTEFVSHKDMMKEFS